MRVLRHWKKILIVCAILLVAAAFVAFRPFSWKKLDMCKLDALSQTTRFYDADDGLFGELSAEENRVITPLSQIQTDVCSAFVAIEDAGFYKHHGVDIKRVGGAVLRNIRAGGYAQGASTITQQLVKLTHLSSDKTLARKANEAYLALRLELRLSKEEILEKYLNVVYFGHGQYGVEAASRYYFGKSAMRLETQEAALLAAIVKSPSGYAPDAHPEKALARRNLVLDAMAEQGYISAERAGECAELPLGIVSKEAEEASFPWFLDTAAEEAMNALNISAEELYTGGYRVYTTLQPEMQRALENLFADDGLFPENAADGTIAQAAAIACDPDTGGILCVMGGRTHAVRRGLNRATSMRRQPGSAFKPVSVYAAAVEEMGFLPTSVADDTQRDFGGGYTPANAGGKYYGAVTLRTALARSLNAATLDLLSKTGVSAARETAMRLGISLDKTDVGMSLGLGSLTYGVSPAQLNNAYAALANGGVAVTAHSVRRIEDADGETVYVFDSEKKRALREETTCILTSMLLSAAQWGSARALSDAPVPVAAKTGTVALSETANRDIWTAAYTPDMAFTVWMGFDETDDKHALPGGSGGGGLPARLAAAFFRDVAPMMDGTSFSVAPGLREALIDQRVLELKQTAVLASEDTPAQYAASELFYADRIPTEVSNYWQKPTAVSDLMLTENGGMATLSFTVLEQDARYAVYKDGAELARYTGGVGDTIHMTVEREGEYSVVALHAESDELASDAARVRMNVALDWYADEKETPNRDETPLFGW